MTAARPFPLPSDFLEGPRAVTHLARATAAFLRAHVRKTAPERVFKQMFDDDRTGEMVLRAAVNPATTTNATWAGPLARATVSQTVVEMASVSAAANLIAAGVRLTFDGYATVHAPGRLVDASDAGNWISEGAPASLRVQRITPGATLTPAKLIVLNAASREQIESSNIEEVSRALLIESMAGALDTAVFGTQPAGASPAGVLNGVAGLTPVAGGGICGARRRFEKSDRSVGRGGCRSKPGAHSQSGAEYVAELDRRSALHDSGLAIQRGRRRNRNHDRTNFVRQRLCARAGI
jgi:hypothetical protein